MLKQLMNRKPKYRKRLILGLILCVLMMSACGRGWRSEKPAIHPNPNMDWQPKFKAQTLPLNPVDGGVIWGNRQSFSNLENRKRYLKEDSRVYEGKYKSGNWVKRIPVPVDHELLKVGKERYDIYCAICHTQTGNGAKSMISQRGWIAADITKPLIRNKRDGEIFNVISNGLQTNGVIRMPGYRVQLTEKERWAIVSYVRALQLVKNARLQNVPKEKRAELK